MVDRPFPDRLESVLHHARQGEDDCRKRDQDDKPQDVGGDERQDALEDFGISQARAPVVKRATRLVGPGR
jgi:hypothetical protein